jgi:hypothetical protein
VADPADRIPEGHQVGAILLLKWLLDDDLFVGGKIAQIGITYTAQEPDRPVKPDINEESSAAVVHTAEQLNRDYRTSHLGGAWFAVSMVSMLASASGHTSPRFEAHENESGSRDGDCENSYGP